MGKPTGFMEFERQAPDYTPVHDRVLHYREFIRPLNAPDLVRQAARCMDCGIPFCHQACPVNNIIPDWNHLTYRDDWREALRNLQSTNNFPEVTGRICPAPCEAGCTLNLTDQPVTIKAIEYALAEKGWEEGWIEPRVPARATGKEVAIVGSGPAGLAAAQQLARVGHRVVVYEKQTRFGGLLRYGIPDFKLEKHIIDRRIAQMQAEGVEFRPNSHVGSDDLPIQALLDRFDAVVLAAGSEKPRDLPVDGRELDGVHFAMDFLTQQNKRLAGEQVAGEDILATDKHVVVIGGGDTGSDCVGTSIRQGARSVTQLELLPQPPEHEDKNLTWPNWPIKLRTSSSQEEGCERMWSIKTARLSGKEGHVQTLHGIKVDGKLQDVPGTEFELKADLVLLAMGFVHPVHEGMLKALGVELDPRGNVAADTDSYRTTIDKVFAAGDVRRGQSLVVWAIREGRQCARAVDEFLMGVSQLPR